MIFTIDSAHAGERLDVFLAREGAARVNGSVPRGFLWKGMISIDAAVAGTRALSAGRMNAARSRGFLREKGARA